jgi:hypothetical protein
MSAIAGTVISAHHGNSPSFSNPEIEQIAHGDRASIARWVHSTAKGRGVSIRLRPSDRFARAVTRLSDGAVDLDQVEDLLIALKRAGVITAFQRGLLQQQYLR